MLPTLSETLALWQRLDNEIGACAILSATECVFEQKDGSKMRFFTGYKRPVEKSLAVFSSQKFLKVMHFNFHPSIYVLNIKSNLRSNLSSLGICQKTLLGLILHSYVGLVPIEIYTITR